jgi:hypothetical protein
LTDADRREAERIDAFKAWDLRRYQARCATFASWSAQPSRHGGASSTRVVRGRDLGELLERLEARSA